MVNGTDYIDLGSLTMDELAGVVHLYPWFASARKELCSRMLRSYIAPAPEAETAGEPGREVHMVGGDYFSKAQYQGVGRADDNIFTRFAVKIKSDGVKDDKTGSDIADRYATATLAEIFAEQGCVEEARRIYSRLILENPEKSAYFAALIDKLN